MPVQHKASDLSPEDRAVVERLLGRALKESEVVQMNAEEEDLARRKHAFQMFVESSRPIQAAFADMPEQELYALLDEACDYVRHNPE